MEKTLVFTHRLELALRLVDTTSGRNISTRDVTVLIDGETVRPGEKADGVLVFQGLGKRAFRMTITSPAFETAETAVDLDALGKGLPLLEVHMVPGARYPGGAEFWTLCGVMEGIESLSAVRVGENACLIREFDPRRRMATVFNPHALALDRVRYALVDPDRGAFEPFRIERLVDRQTIKTDRVLEMPYKNYFPITPEICGVTREDGSFCLRVRDDAAEAKWLVRWEKDGEEHFKTVDFKAAETPSLEEKGGG